MSKYGKILRWITYGLLTGLVFGVIVFAITGEVPWVTAIAVSIAGGLAIGFSMDKRGR